MLVVVFLAGFAAAGFISRQLLQENAREEVLRNARLMMDTALAVRAYTAEQVKPHLDKQLEDLFLPQTVPAYAATETLGHIRKKYRDYSYKEATLNPTNPRDRATDWEADLVQQFRQNPESRELISERHAATGRLLYIAKPIQITNAACLQCHSVPGNAPASMLKIYGEANGFGWKHNEIIGAQVVTVPMDIPILNADRAFKTFMVSLAGVFVVVFIVLNLMLSWLIVRPVRRMSQAADKVSTGDFDVPEFADGGQDEVAVLGRSFNRMRRSLEKAMQMIDRDDRAAG
ncbi:MAG: c-type heme family protein [Polaromonas sp.]